MLAIKGKNIFIYYLFPNILKYKSCIKISVDLCYFTQPFCHKKFYIHLSKMVKGYMVREWLGTPVLDERTDLIESRRASVTPIIRRRYARSPEEISEGSEIILGLNFARTELFSTRNLMNMGLSHWLRHTCPSNFCNQSDLAFLTARRAAPTRLGLDMLQVDWETKLS